MKIIHYSFLFILLLLFGCTADDETIYGKVVRVADGDTITLLVDGTKQIKVRLYGIDCPEYKQDFSKVAKDFTAEKCFQKNVAVEVIDVDKYDRIVGMVILPNGDILNEELLKAGLAWHYKHFDKSERFAELERVAQEKKIGIWSIENPLEPWDFRRRRNKH